LAAYHATADERYAAAARKTWNLLAKPYYDEPSGLFRTELGSDVVTLTPYDVGIQLGAIREIMFSTPVHLIEPLVDWFPRWWVQTVNTSGMQQSEDNRTGELFYGVRDADFDDDGIPFMGEGPGRHGIAPVLAGKVIVSLGDAGKEAFEDARGEVHDPARWGGDVRYGYKKGTLRASALPVTIQDEDLIERSPMKRFDGMTYPLPASRPHKPPATELTAKQLIRQEANCVFCHGWNGEGITGLPWKADAFERDRDSMFEIPKFGRASRLMPEWGLGHSDGVGTVLSDEEIYRIVDFVQSEEFRTLIDEAQEGIIDPQFPPKDAYFYISRAYLNGRDEPATRADILTVLEAYERAVATNTKINVLELLGASGPGN
ncbi:MAG: c-type cytochrome, partial [Acidobacteriota bacterium]